MSFGDRRDARRLKPASLMQLAVDLKPGRKNSDVYINQKMDVTRLCEYVKEKKEEGQGLTFFQVYLAACAKTLYVRPKLNRFIANRHLYEHKQVTVSFVAKVSFDDRSEELMLVIPVDKEDTLATIGQKVKDKVDALRSKRSSGSKKGANSAVDTLAKLPNVLRVPVVGLIKLLDRLGILPESLAKDNIYYSSMIISNLGAIHCGAIYHNLNDFGCCSSLATMGEICEEKVLINGREEVRKLCEFGITLDERIGDGYYFAKSCQLIQYLLNNPELLEQPMGEPMEVPEIR